MRLLLALLLLTITTAAHPSTNKKYGELGERISQAEFEANQSEPLAMLIPLIKDFEGFSPKAIRDKDGTWTIGFGHTAKNINVHSIYSRRQGEIQLQIDAGKALADALEYSPVLKKEPVERQVAIADFIFNVGIGNYQKSDVRHHIDKREFNEAKIDLLHWNHVRNKVFRGLAVRRRVEAGLLNCNAN